MLQGRVSDMFNLIQWLFLAKRINIFIGIFQNIKKFHQYYRPHGVLPRRNRMLEDNTEVMEMRNTPSTYTKSSYSNGSEF